MDWSPQQAQALDAVGDWLKSSVRPIFRLFGYAGTGKTTLAKHFAEGVKGTVLFAAYTGKAASVMRSKGCWNAQTIHSLIYRPRDRSGEDLRNLEERLLKLQLADPINLDAIERVKREIAVEKARVRQPAFELNRDSDLALASLLIIDECSMVGEQMGEDLLSFRVPILVLGDPAQLPPVRSAAYFTGYEPDVLLTEIHRQEADNPIITLATAAREQRPIEYGQYGDSAVLRVEEFKQLRNAEIAAQSQILVGRNTTRIRANNLVRKERGFTKVLPERGDKLVCLRNDHEVGLLNGTIWVVDDVLGAGRDNIYLRVTEEGGDMTLAVEAHQAPFRGGEVPIWIRREAQEFDYGYALTVHKAQGSQWDSVVLVDESASFKPDAAKHLYTGITRAAKRVLIVR